MKKIFILIILTILFIGCVTVDYVKTTEKRYSPTNSVKIFWAEPDFDYEVLGRFRVTGEYASESMMIEELLRWAKDEGVNGLIILSTSEDDAYVWTQSGVITVDTTIIHALAIRF